MIYLICIKTIKTISFFDYGQQILKDRFAKDVRRMIRITIVDYFHTVDLDVWLLTIYVILFQVKI